MFSTNYYSSRFFNKVSYSNGIVIKSSTDINKIRSEFLYYSYVPDTIKGCFVKPYDFRIVENVASYKMEQIETPNLAELFFSDKIDDKECKTIFSKIDLFLKQCNILECDIEEVKKDSFELIIKKPEDRIKNFTLEGYDLEGLLQRINKAYHFYSPLRKKWFKKISHGDLCLSNMLWDKEKNSLLFIDPRGALVENDIYMDEYYDLAKLSHSIIHDYDKILLGDFNINDFFKKSFTEYLMSNDICIDLLRVYEASLFLSMIPLHQDNNYSMLRFADACDNILKGVNF